MIIKFFPAEIEPDKEGAVQVFIRKNLAKRPNLQLRVKEFLKKVDEVDDLSPFFKNESITPIKDDLYEMRIPKRSKKGVVRIYFCFHPENPMILILLEAELKHKKEAMNKETAMKRLKIYMDNSKGH